VHFVAFVELHISDEVEPESKIEPTDLFHPVTILGDCPTQRGFHGE
jgi:hypothetical protein